MRRIRRKLGVRYIVEGSVRTSANRIRITAQLIEAVSSTHPWSERYDRNVDELLDVQDEVPRTFVASVTGQVEGAEIKKISAHCGRGSADLGCDPCEHSKTPLNSSPARRLG